jgi:hypothetical protein
VAARFRRNLRQNLAKTQHKGTIKISHGMTATTTVISEAVLSARTAPDSRRASAICAKPRALPVGLSTRKVISTAICLVLSACAV